MTTRPQTAATDASVDDLAVVLEKGATLIDVRERTEYADGHVPGARLMPMGQLPARLVELEDTEPVYLICATGNRSGAMTDFLTHAGFEAHNVSGGTSAWARSGRPLRTGINA